MKTHINITIDADVYLELHSKKIKVSPLINDFLRQYVKLDEKPSKNQKSLAQLEKETTKAEIKLLKLKDKAKKIRKEESKIKWLK